MLHPAGDLNNDCPRPRPRPPPRSPLWSVLASEKGDWYYTKAVGRSSCPILEIFRTLTIYNSYYTVYQITSILFKLSSNSIQYIETWKQLIRHPTQTKLVEIWKSKAQSPKAPWCGHPALHPAVALSKSKSVKRMESYIYLTANVMRRCCPGRGEGQLFNSSTSQNMFGAKFLNIINPDAPSKSQ